MVIFPARKPIETMNSSPTHSPKSPEPVSAAGTNSLFFILAIPLAAILVIAAIFSLRWRIVHDLPIMLYFGLLTEHFGFVPYRDFFDFNLPAMHLFSATIGRIIGYSNLGLRIVDLCWLSAIIATTAGYLRRIDRRAALIGPILFGLAYLWSGPYMSLQREYLIILPLALALWALFSASPKIIGYRPFFVGLFFGLAAAIKLHAAIGFPLAIWYLIVENRDGNRKISYGRNTGRGIVLKSFSGFLLPLAATVLCLWFSGGLPAFWEIATKYWPLYTGLTVNHTTISGANRLMYIVERFGSLGGHALWVVPAALAMYIVLNRTDWPAPRKRRVVFLGGMTLAYAFYPAIAGQFWTYHWLLFLYFVIQMAALCLVAPAPGSTRLRRLFPAAALVVVICLKILAPHHFLAQAQYADATPQSRAVDEIAEYLSAELRPGDTVQPLDWTNGAVQAMLIAGARPATRFVYSFSFYHHITNPYIKRLRREFMAELEQAQPRFIVKMTNGYPGVRGLDTTDDFLALDRFIAAEYTLVRAGDGYHIFQRKADGQ